MSPSSRCPDAQALLPALVEGELSAVEERRVRGHLNLCAACRHEEARYRTSLGSLHGVPAARPANDLFAGFAAKLHRAETRAARRRIQSRWALSFAGVAAVAGAGAMLAPRMLRPAVPAQAEPPSVAMAPVEPRHEAAVKRPAPVMAKSTPDMGDPFHWIDVPKGPDSVDKPAANEASLSVTTEQARPVTASPRQHHRTAVAIRPAIEPDFLHVPPKVGLPAYRQLEITAHAQTEETVAAVRPPVPTGEPPARTEHVAPRHPDVALDSRPQDLRQPVPSGGAAPADHTDAAIPRAAPTRPAAVVPVFSRRIAVDGNVTQVDTSVGLDHRGRAVQLNVNIGTMRPLRTAPAVRTPLGRYGK